MATQTLWPNIGVSELAEDGVTPITTDGIIVTLVQDTPVSALKLPDYYALRVARSRLLTYDPLALGGDPTTVPAVTRLAVSLTATFDVMAPPYNAVPGDTGNQAPAIQAAIDAAAAAATPDNRARVIVKGGTFRTTEKITAKNYVTIEFVDARIHATSDCAIECVSTIEPHIVNPDLVCDGGVDGIRLRMGTSPSTGATLYPRIENPRILLGLTGSPIGISFVQDGTGASGNDVHYFPRILNPYVSVVGGANYNATAIRMRGASGLGSRSVGGIVEGGDISNVGKGIDIDNCDTWRIREPSFHGVLGVPITSTPGANAGNGTCTALSWNGSSSARRAMAGTWTLTCTSAVANGGVWRLRNPLGADAATGLTMTPGAGAATAFDSNGLQWTLTDGSADFQVGDSFSIVVPDTAAITFGPFTNQCEILRPRFEDCDRDIRFIRDGANSPLGCNVEYAGSFGLATHVFDMEAAGDPSVRHIGTQQLSQRSESYLFGRRAVFGNSFELNCYEVKEYTAGSTITTLADASGVVSPRIRLVADGGGPGVVTISGINRSADVAPGDPIQGDFRLVHLADAGTLVISHEDTVGTTDYRRTHTMSGAAERYVGPCAVLFVYDKTRNGAGVGRYLCLGQVDRTQYRFGSLTVDVASIASGALSAEQTITVTGAALGDAVEVSCSLDLAGLFLFARVSAADTVKFHLFNPTAGAIDLASATFYARVRKR